MENRVHFKADVDEFLAESLKLMVAVRGNNTDYCYWNELKKILIRPPSFTTLRANIQQKDIKFIKKQLQDSIDQRPAMQSLKVECHTELSDVLVVRNIGPNLVKQVASEVIVDHACGMAVLRGAEIYCQGVLAMTTDIREGSTVSVYSDIYGQCRKGQTEVFTGVKIFLGNGVALVGRKELFTDISKTGVAITMSEPLYISPSLSCTLPHILFAQNLPSIVCGHVLGARAGEYVLDMCAAPGGKTNHVASMMNGKGTLIALEKAKNKIGRIQENLRRWKLEENVHVFSFDSTKAFDDTADPSITPPWPSEMFDRILVDGPCSALGQRPYYNHKLALSELASYPVLQRKLLQAAVPLLKVGGTLVYSTCTFTVEENESMVAWALERFPQLQLTQQKPYLGLPGRSGCGLSDELCRLVQRFDPVDARNELNHDTTAFFIAKFIKNRQ